MEAINLSGITFVDNLNNLALETGQVVAIKHHPDLDDNEYALGVHLDCGTQIGWIPKQDTIRKYGEEQKKLGNDAAVRMQRDRWITAGIIRDYAWTDLYRNHIIPTGHINRIQTDYETGEIQSLSVTFNYY